MFLGVGLAASLPHHSESFEVEGSATRDPTRKRRADKGLAVRSRDRSGFGQPPAYGALDLGTNNCRLLIARPSRHGLSVVDAFSRIVRLGEGLGHSGALLDSAMERTVEALRVCSNKLKWHNVGPRRLIATEACRLAANGSDFIARVAEDVGLQLEIIDRKTEASLAASGASPLIEQGAQSAVIFDIGGGSTEVMWMQATGSGYEMKAWVSLAVGVVTLSERLNGGRDVTVETFQAMCAEVRRLLQPFVAEVTSFAGSSPQPDHLLGTSGTVTTIAGVHLGLRYYDRSKVDGSWLTNEGAGAVTQKLLSMSYEERVQNGCIGKERADLVLAGCAILEEIRLAFPSPRIRVADRGLREGILIQMMQADGVWGNQR
jgi:exopolyphosphatase / guanosine-5'-triphosphate,3'-diphosphate pyrophosphatase